MEVFVDEFKAEIKRLRGEHHRTIRPLQKELQKIERGIRRCLDFNTGGDGDPRLVAPELATLEKRKVEIEAQLDAAEPDDNIELHPNMAELYRKKVEDLQNILLDKVTRPEAIDIFRSLIERVEINPGKERAPVTLSSLAHLPPYLPSWNKKQPPPLEETTVRS
jgi:site-specific DNA recombinase